MSILGFEVEWFDPSSKLVHKLFLKIYMDDKTLEILQESKKTPFLKRIQYDDVTIDDLFIGNSVTIFSRVLTIKAYANGATESYMASKEVHFLCALNSKACHVAGDLLNLCLQFNLNLGRVKTCAYGIIGSFQVSDGDILIELVSLSNKTNSQAVIAAAEAISSGISVEILSTGAIADLISSGGSVAVRGINTLCIIKPHILKEKRAGDVLKMITDNGFDIKGLFSLHCNAEIAEDLFGVYRGTYPKYAQMIAQMLSGFSLAVLIQRNEEVVGDFRTLCGPLEPEIARTLRPNTIRAVFGKDTVHNAVHCTDLQEDGDMETRFIFETLANL
eukprot:gene12517-26373_t